MMMISSIGTSLHIFLFLLFAFTTNAQLNGTWPPVDKPPPTDANWTKLVDMTKVPNAPLAKNETDCPTNDTYCNWSCTQCVRPADIIQCPGKTDWGLTFDDGPTQFTPPLLDYLASKNVTLTLFVIGSRVYENPQILQNAVKAGHQIGVHTWSHPYLTTQSNEQIIAEIKWTEKAIQQAVGLTPKYMRPPFGNIDDRVRAIMGQLGYKIVIWDKDTNDWVSGDDPTFQMSWVTGNFTKWVKENSTTGHISLQHDLYNQTAAEGPKVVPIVQGAGFNIKRVASCLGDPNPYLESLTANTTSSVSTSTPTSTSTSTSTPTPTVSGSNGQNSPIPGTVPPNSSANSNINNNSYLFALSFFIIGSFMIM